MLWAIEPECVDVSRIPAPDVPGPHFAMGDDARAANRLIGERMVADEVRWLGAKAAELVTAYEQEQPTQRLRTFADVEQHLGRRCRAASVGVPDDAGSLERSSSRCQKIRSGTRTGASGPDFWEDTTGALHVRLIFVAELLLHHLLFLRNPEQAE